MTAGPTTAAHAGRQASHVAIVTGANHGIGAATAVALASRGCAVLCAFWRVRDPVDPGIPQAYRDRRAGGADAVVAEIEAAGGRSLAVEADLADPRTPAEVRRRVDAMYVTLDPVQLLSEMRAAQQRLVEIADKLIKSETTTTAPTLEQFLSGLRTAWKEGEVRPTARAKVNAKRLRRRPDPFAAVSGQLRGWFEAEPARTGRELLDRLQREYPAVYPNSQLRTLQRRLKEWRREMARQMVFGHTSELVAVEPMT